MSTNCSPCTGVSADGAPTEIALTAGQAGLLLGLHHREVARLVRQGRLRADERGRINRSDLEKFIEETDYEPATTSRCRDVTP